MAGKKPALGTMEPRLGGIRVQTSLYGQAIAVPYGRCRITGNLLQYVAFKAVRQEEQSEAAKGGGSRPGRIYYQYSASVAMLLGEGPITAVRQVWKGKQRFGGESTAATASAAKHAATVPGGAPYQVTVPGTWTGTVHVAIVISDPLSWPPYNEALVEGVDYTVAAGVYTFAAARANAPVEITYTLSTAAASVDALGQLGLTLVPGRIGQATWQYMASNYPAEAVPYAGFAYVRGQDYPLSSAAEVENHSFEVDGLLQTQTEGDAHPADIVADMLQNTRYGSVGWPRAYLDAWTSYRQYVDGYGLYISPACQEQRATRDWIADILDATNTDAAWAGSQLKLVPRGDENAGSYVAPTTPVFALGPDDFLAEEGMPPFAQLRSSQGETPNVVRAEFANRARDYAFETIEAIDEAAIIAHGRKPEATQTWHFFCTGAVREALQRRLQRIQSVRNQWQGTLPWRFAELEIGDLVTLSDPKQHLAGWPVRVLAITEDGDDFDCVFEDFPIGHATAPIVAPQLGTGFRPDFNADPGNVATPVFIEPPGGYTQNGLEVWVALSGQAGAPGAMWGGAEVYASLDDGASYKLVGRVDQGARFGTLNFALATGTSAELDVQLLGRGGQLRSVSATEADALTTLAFVGTPATGEFIAFQTATLIGADRYKLGGLRRAQFGTTDQAAAIGASFVYIDGAVAMSGPLPTEMIGRTIKFKFCSFNVFGGGLQSLASVTEYSHVLSGRFRDQVAVAPVSANLLTGAGFLPSAFGLETYRLNTSATVSVDRERFFPLPGSPTNARLTIDGAATGSASLAGARFPRVPVNPAKRYCAFAELIGWDTGAGISVDWYDEANAFIVSATSYAATSGDTARRPERAADYLPATLRELAPPANARFARLGFFGSINWTSAAQKYVWCLRPFLGEIPRNAVELPPWDAGSPAPTRTVRKGRRAGPLRLSNKGASPLNVYDVFDEPGLPPGIVRIGLTAVCQVIPGTSQLAHAGAAIVVEINGVAAVIDGGRSPLASGMAQGVAVTGQVAMEHIIEAFQGGRIAVRVTGAQYATDASVADLLEVNVVIDIAIG
jgi:hypothetical protein